MGKRWVKLTHSSNAPGASGRPGDVIEVDDSYADSWIAGRGAVEADPPGTATPKADAAPTVVVSPAPVKRTKARRKKASE